VFTFLVAQCKGSSVGSKVTHADALSGGDRAWALLSATTGAMTLLAELSFRADAEQVRLRLGTAFIEYSGDLWPQGMPSVNPRCHRRLTRRPA
jgi:hypothetical protein